MFLEGKQVELMPLSHYRQKFWQNMPTQSVKICYAAPSNLSLFMNVLFFPVPPYVPVKNLSKYLMTI